MNRENLNDHTSTKLSCNNNSNNNNHRDNYYPSLPDSRMKQPTGDYVLTEGILHLSIYDTLHEPPTRLEYGVQPKQLDSCPSPSTSSGCLFPLTSDVPTKLSPNRYKTELCRSFSESGRCRYATKCQYAHGLREVRSVIGRHPKYKTERCRTYHETGFCTYGPRCNFVHGEPEPPLVTDCKTERWEQCLGGEEDLASFVNSGQWTSEVKNSQIRSFPLPCPPSANGKLGDSYNPYASLNNSIGTASIASSSPSSRTGSPVDSFCFEDFRVFF